MPLPYLSHTISIPKIQKCQFKLLRTQLFRNLTFFESIQCLRNILSHLEKYVPEKNQTISKLGIE